MNYETGQKTEKSNETEGIYKENKTNIHCHIILGIVFINVYQKTEE